ncbi:MAG: hypothetical protein ICV78_06745 [Tolypothrix sp. Co-bin9]|nr:hypothetical protein [Tolypothrix sp. Co-bin9]
MGKQDLERLNPNSLSGLVKVNPPLKKTDKSSASSNPASPQAEVKNFIT